MSFAGQLTGGYSNPAIALALMMSRGNKVSVKIGAVYMISEFLGAIAGGALGTTFIIFSFGSDWLFWLPGSTRRNHSAESLRRRSLRRIHHLHLCFNHCSRYNDHYSFYPVELHFDSNRLFYRSRGHLSDWRAESSICIGRTNFRGDKVSQMVTFKNLLDLLFRSNGGLCHCCGFL